MKQQGVLLYPSLVGMPVYGRFPFPVFHPVFLPFFYHPYYNQCGSKKGSPRPTQQDSNVWLKICFFVDTHSKFSSFNASKELPFDLEDALLLWINKISAVLNENQLKKQKQHAEQLLQNQDKAKRFRFRRDQLQPKVQTVFPLMEELLKDVSDGKSLLGIIMFYHPTVINIEGTLWCIIM